MTRKTAFLKGWSWFKFDNMGLVLVTKFKFYNSVAKGLKLKVRTFWGLIPTFVEVTGEKLVGGVFLPSILNRVKRILSEFLIFVMWLTKVSAQTFTRGCKNVFSSEKPYIDFLILWTENILHSDFEDDDSTDKFND